MVILHIETYLIPCTVISSKASRLLIVLIYLVTSGQAGLKVLINNAHSYSPTHPQYRAAPPRRD